MTKTKVKEIFESCYDDKPTVVEHSYFKSHIASKYSEPVFLRRGLIDGKDLLLWPLYKLNRQIEHGSLVGMFCWDAKGRISIIGELGYYVVNHDCNHESRQLKVTETIESDLSLWRHGGGNYLYQKTIFCSDKASRYYTAQLIERDYPDLQVSQSGEQFNAPKLEVPAQPSE